MSSLALLRSELNQFAAKNVQSGFPSSDERAKIINDPIWGNVKLSDWEIKTLDLKLLQRLRFISQNGMASLVYPTAKHTRFDHTIGTMAIINIIAERGCKKVISDQVYNILRLAALLHDVGHMAFSHVSEKFFNSLPFAKQFFSKVRSELEEEYRKQEKTNIDFYGYSDSSFLNRLLFEGGKNQLFGDVYVKIHEIVSALIVDTPVFHDYIKTIWVRDRFDEPNLFVGVREEDRPIHLAKLIGKCIMGIPVITYPKNEVIVYGYITDLINGPMDVDKMDYLARDCYMAGLTIGYDMHRLFSKINIIPIFEDAEIKRIKSMRFVLQYNSSHVLEQLMINKVMLYSYMYHHHKILVGDNLVCKIFSLVSRDNFLNINADDNKDEEQMVPEYAIIKNIFDLLTLTEADFFAKGGLIHLIDDKLISLEHTFELSTIKRANIQNRLNIAKLLIKNLADRHMAKRSLVVRPSYIIKEDKLSTLESVFSELKTGVSDLLLKAIRLMDINRLFDKLINIPQGLKDIYEFIDVGNDNILLLDYLFDVIIPSPPDCHETREVLFATWDEQPVYQTSLAINRWINTYDNYKWTIYVVSVDQLRVLVNIISRYYLLSKKGWILHQQATNDAHLFDQDIKDVLDYLISLPIASDFDVSFFNRMKQPAVGVELEVAPVKED